MQSEISKLWESKGNATKRRKWESRRNILCNNGQELSIITDRHESAGPKRSKSNQQNECQKQHLDVLYSNYREKKDRKFWKKEKSRENLTLPVEEKVQVKKKFSRVLIRNYAREVSGMK